MFSLRPILFAIAGFVTFVPARPGDLLRAEAEVPRTDCYGDPLPPGAVMRLGTSRFRDAQRCYTVAYSPDGKLLASGGSGGVVLWDAQSGKPRAFLESRLIPNTSNVLGKQLSRSVYRLAFSSDGRYLAAGCTGEAIIWELATGKASYLPGDGKESAMDLVGFTPDNRGVFTGDANEIRLRDWRTGRDLKRWAVPVSRSSQEVGRVFGNKVLSTDGTTIIANVVDDESRQAPLRVWDVGSGKERRIEGGPGLFAISPDHRTLAVLDPRGGKLTFVDVVRGTVIRTLLIDWPIERCNNINQGSIAFSPDGKWFAASDTVWSVATGKEVCKLEIPCGRAFGLCFSPDGKTLVAAKGVWIDFWKLPSGKRVHDFPNHRGEVVDLAYSPEGRQLATLGSDSTVRLWDTRMGRLIRSFGKAKPFTFSLAFSPDGQRLVTEHGTSLVIWDVGEGRELREILADPGSGFRRIAAIAPDGTALFAVQGALIREWDMASGKERRRFEADKTDIYTMALSPDGKVVAAASTDLVIRVWDRVTGKLMRELRAPHGRSSVWFALSFAPSGDLLAALSGDGEGIIDFADVACGRYWRKIIPDPEQEDKGRKDRIWPSNWSVAFSPDGKTILCSVCSSDPLHLIEVFSGKDRVRFNTTGRFVLSPDGKTFASTSHGGALIWDITGYHRTGVQDRLSDEELERLWADLASTDATAAHRAIWTLIAGKKEAVSFLRRRVRAVPGLSAARMKELIDGLDSDNFQERERAARELAEQAEAAKPALLAAVAKNQSLEQRLRATNLLAALPAPFLPASRLRIVRAIEIFEQVGDQESQKALEVLATGAAGRVETEQAKAALQRLRRRDR